MVSNDAVVRQHPVLAVVAERLASGSRPGERPDGHRVVLSIEGGGNRGVIAGGMALALHERGLLSAFDAVYGASSGALTAAWLLSGDIATGMHAWTRPADFARFSRLSNLLRRRPLVDLSWLIGEYYDRRLGLNAAEILANPVSIHPLATDVDTGSAVDLHPRISDKESLHTALRASAALPLVAGKPVELAGRRYLDAGVAESVPFETPLAAGATHMLVLTSRKNDDLAQDPLVVRRIADAWLRRAAPGARAAFLARETRSAATAERLANHSADPDGSPAVLAIRPGPDTPRVARMESDGSVIAAGLAAGHDAMAAILDDGMTARS
ncbi:patatin-like phospholipase family protein [Haloechinothrix salitolerans]|uniref:Patatin family protein n=1 Tax=Haloechinothrix salitolerans TaxID=926830 RepID=A0ABW2C1F8_9PSEU